MTHPTAKNCGLCAHFLEGDKCRDCTAMPGKVDWEAIEVDRQHEQAIIKL